jgi:SNF2 family DNA or RNA helicase
MGPDGKPKELAYFEDNPKLDAVMETLEDATEQGHKSIVWCRFLPEIQKLAQRLGEVKIGTVLFTGQTDERERDLRIRAFQERPDVQIFVGQIQAGGVGITLTAATKVLYYSNTLSLEDRLQSEDRAHRIGQKQDVEYFDFSYRRSVDMAIRKALASKKNFADIITGDNIRRAYEGELDLEDLG